MTVARILTCATACSSSAVSSFSTALCCIPCTTGSSGKALLQLEDSQVNGNTITYNTETENYNAESKSNERTKTIFQPKDKIDTTVKKVITQENK